MAGHAGLWEYASRITPTLNCALLVLLIVLSFVVQPFGVQDDGPEHRNATLWQQFLCALILFLHIVSLLFPIRALFALKNVILNIKQAAERRVAKDDHAAHNAVRFAILLPAYKEDKETLQRTLSILASHGPARCMYHIYLAFEEREEGAAKKADELISAFQHRFIDISVTLHPYGLPGEVPGKSSNEAWAAKQVLLDYHDSRLEDVIITTMDSDTHLPSSYFTQILEMHSRASIEDRESTIYMPPLVFDRNINKTPLLVRIADVLWACAGISSMYSGCNVAIPTSVYSLPLSLVDQVGGWDTNASAIGEDMHMYLKCFFALKGNLSARVVYAAASQCSVGSGSPGLGGYLRDILARHQQAMRHMWGSLDTGYAVRQVVGMLSRPKSTQGSYQSLATCNEQNFQKLERIPTPTITTFKSMTQQRPNWRNILIVFSRLFEAHQLPIQLVLVIITSDLYRLSYPNFLIPPAINQILEFCKICRTVSFFLMLAVFYRYERYHRLCAGMRKEEMMNNGLWDDACEEEDFAPRVFRYGIVEALLFPVGGLLFGAIPALQAMVMHLFTENLVYHVSLKPQLSSLGSQLKEATSYAV